jgi:hypothetical protein
VARHLFQPQDAHRPPLQTLSNILAAIREGDYSIRGRRALSGDALGEVMLEVNDLGQTLARATTGRDGSDRAVAYGDGGDRRRVFAFDGEQRLQLVNRAGEKIVGPTFGTFVWVALPMSWAFPLVSTLPPGAAPQTMQMVFPGGVGVGTFVAALFVKVDNSISCSCSLT